MPIMKVIDSQILNIKFFSIPLLLCKIFIQNMSNILTIDLLVQLQSLVLTETGLHYDRCQDFGNR